MTPIWFLIWLIANNVGGPEPLIADPVNGWAATLILDGRARPHPAVTRNARRPGRSERKSVFFRRPDPPGVRSPGGAAGRGVSPMTVRCPEPDHG